MRKLFSLKIGWGYTIFSLLDIIATGMGMGVPFFNILLGFPVGWYIARRLSKDEMPTRRLMGKSLLWSALTAGFTVILMLIIWAPTASMLFDTAADLANFGIPMILYEPRASFIGWLALMTLISPFLQFLMTLFGSQVTQMAPSKRDKPVL